MFIFGLSLAENEVFLRWLLIQRAKYYRKFPERGHSAWYLVGKEESEAGIAKAYHRWYWQHEVETEREYRWLGKVAVKMPTDLFFYQEVLSELSRRHILELGYGKGWCVAFL